MIILIYFAVLIGLGLWWRRSARDSSGYFLAGRTLPGWQAGLSMAATAFGGSAILAASEFVYRNGISGIWFSLAPAIGFGVLGLGFARQIRATGAVSLADYIGRRYGPQAHWVSSLLLIVVELGFFGITIKGFAVLTRPLLSDSLSLMISDTTLQVGVCAVFVTYTMLGGQMSDVMADLIRLVIIGLALINVLLPIALVATDWHALPAGHLAFPFNPITGTGPLFVFNMLLMMGLPSIIGGDVFAKVLSTRDSNAARRAFILACVVRALLAVCVAVLALSARALLPTLETPAQAIPMLARELLSPGYFQFIALALLSGLLCTSDSVLITMSTVMTLDILKLGAGVAMWKARLITLAVALGGLVLALKFSGLLEIIRFSYTLLTAGIAAPLLVAMIVRRPIASGGFLAALGTGVFVALAWRFYGAAFPVKVDPATPGALASALVMLLAIPFSARRAS